MSSKSPKTPQTTPKPRLPANVNTTIVTAKPSIADSDPHRERIETLQKTYEMYSSKLKMLQKEMERATDGNYDGADNQEGHDQRSVQEIESELGHVEKQRYEAGLMLSRAYKKRRESVGSTDFWVRGVGIA